MQNMNTKRDLEFLYEMGSLRFIDRAWKQFLGPSFANLADHHLRVIWLSLILAKMESRKVDLQKIMMMALVHDIAESRTGDVHYISRQYTKRDEAKAIADILKDTVLSQEMSQAWHEYEARESLEAKIVKDADWLDVDLEIQEQKAMGRVHMEAWDDNRTVIAKLFFTQSAKRLWKAIQKSKPHDWYRHARNRFVEGDIKQALDKKNHKY